MANVGRRFYLHGESKQEIAQVLGALFTSGGGG